MSTYSFTATQEVYSFTATVSNPAALTLAEYPEDVSIVNVTNTVTVTNVYQPVIVAAASGANYDQNLNTTNEVAFQSVTTPVLNGGVNTPIYFQTGIDTTNYGTTFIGNVDLGQLGPTTITNQLALLFTFLPIDLGQMSDPLLVTLDFNPN